GHLVVADECLDRLVAGEPRLGRCLRRNREQQRRDHDDAEAAPQPRKDQSLFPTKLSGMTRMIAIAADTIFPQPIQSRKMKSQNCVAANATAETMKKRMPW